jgi:hypothetical protein
LYTRCYLWSTAIRDIKTKCGKEFPWQLLRTRNIQEKWVTSTITVQLLQYWDSSSYCDVPLIYLQWKLREGRGSKILLLYRTSECGGYNWHAVFWETEDSSLSRKPATVTMTSHKFNSHLGEKKYLRISAPTTFMHLNSKSPCGATRCQSPCGGTQ